MKCKYKNTNINRSIGKYVDIKIKIKREVYLEQ